MDNFNMKNKNTLLRNDPYSVQLYTELWWTEFMLNDQERRWGGQQWKMIYLGKDTGKLSNIDNAAFSSCMVGMVVYVSLLFILM